MAHLKLGRKLFLCFQLCGLNLINLSTLNKNTKKKNSVKIKYHLYHLLHIVIFCANLVIVLSCPNSIMFAFDPLGKFNDWIKYYAAITTSCIILLESYVRVEQLIDVFHQSFKLEAIFRAIKIDLSQQNENSTRIYMRKFVFYIVLLFALELWSVPFLLRNTPQLNYWILSMPLVIQSRFRQLQHLYCIDLCHHYSRTLACNIKQLAIFLNTLDITTPCNPISLEKYRMKFIHHRFRILQKSYYIIWKMANSVNLYFGWSQVANYAGQFLQLLSDFYWLYWRFYNESYGFGMCSMLMMSNFINYPHLVALFPPHI